MAEQQVMNLSCSFCGKSQSEVKKLIAGPKVYICDECIGLCNQILGEEISPDDRCELAAESVRGIVGALVAQEARASDFLHACATHAGSPLPESTKESIPQLVAASRALRWEVDRWSEAEDSEVHAGSVVPAWLGPCLGPLGRTADALRTLRPALEKLVPESGSGDR